MAVKEEVSFISPEEEAVIRGNKTNAPELFTFDCGQLPFERMGDAQFELLVADIYRAEYESNAENWYDRVRGESSHMRQSNCDKKFNWSCFLSFILVSKRQWSVHNHPLSYMLNLTSSLFIF